MATCRPGLEGVLAAEIEKLGGRSIKPGKRSVAFSTNHPGLYRMNMALRAAIQVLVPIRTFNARDYKLLYFQSRRTNWHQYFTADKTLRIDVNGHSPTLQNTQYVVHRVKDGIVDTFRKMTGGIRPSIDKAEPEIHVVVHMHGSKITLCLDSSGIPLFKRGYRLEHGEAPIKEDLAAGILQLSNAKEHAGIVDPMCGSGTFLFEGMMLMHDMAPNLKRSFAFQHWLDYDEEAFLAEQASLEKAGSIKKDIPIVGCDIDEESIDLVKRIAATHFPDIPLTLHHSAFQEVELDLPNCLMVTNPPYGKRLGEESELPALYRDIGTAAKKAVMGGRLAVFTTNRKAARQIRLTQDRSCTLFNGALEGLLYEYSVRGA
ncbi:hypothetical protein G0Q06_01545 [Puniceicoccales bacterium CK1056]|uniref:THUMP domain-containing protein n=1 Tax=Oceanipulchritudo coccoides TaxID=2706888 RepID=A0A6B2LZC8_9BACT|nr:hypothetical protein [Oceanipulchritudo coccoides]